MRDEIDKTPSSGEEWKQASCFAEFLSVCSLHLCIPRTVNHLLEACRREGKRHMGVAMGNRRQKQ